MSSRIKKYGGPPLLMRNERDKKLFKELKTKVNERTERQKNIEEARLRGLTNIPKRTVNFKFDSLNQTKNEIEQKIKDFLNKIYPKSQPPSSKTLNNNISNSKILNGKTINSASLSKLVIIPLIIFIVIICLVIFKVPLTATADTSILKNVFIVITFIVFLLFFVSVTTLPILKDLNTFFMQIHNVLYVIVYVIFLILLLGFLPDDILNKYAYLITPSTLLLTIFVFYKSFKVNYITDFNINYERIKSIILFFCLIAIFIIYYTKDPGGYISKYFGFSMVLTIVLSIFSFLYLTILLTLPDTSNKPQSNTSDNLLNKFSNLSVYGTILFFIFIVVLTTTLSIMKGEDSGYYNLILPFVIILTIVTCSLWSLFLIPNLFSDTINSSNILDKFDFYKKGLLALFAIIISIFIIIFIVYNVQQSSSVTSIVLNVLLICLVLTIIYRTIIIDLPYGNSKKNSFFDLIINVVFFIPCLLSNTINFFYDFFTEQYKLTTSSAIMLLIISILLLVVYFSVPLILDKLYLQGGKLLVNQPVYLSNSYVLGNYETLNGSDKFDYQYSISFWFYLNSVPPNTNPSYTKYTSLLNFGEKPNVLYNAVNNSLMITMQQSGLQKNTTNKLIDFDENGNRIVYKQKNVLLQKWNNIIINYNGGILDIFLNGELVKSNIEVVPYYTLDNLTIGEDNGINGSMCNLVYFNKPLTSYNIYYLYNMVKNKNPPVMKETNETILKENISTAIN
jgi:hypothetical protein